LIKFFLTGFARLPLRVNHWLGAVLGWAMYVLSPRLRQRTRENLARYFAYTGLSDKKAQTQLLRQTISESGKGIAELAVVWLAPVTRLHGLVKTCSGWEHVAAAQKQGKGIIFVSPHLGCFDIAGRYLSSRLELVALYRPPKLKWLEPLMQAGRARSGIATAPAGLRGVRQLLKALREQGSTMILPDQVPAPEQGGEGVWADLFGAPAYTMTLLPRLAESTGAATLFFFAGRLPHGAGYHVHIEPLPQPFAADKALAARQTNVMVEKLVAMAPAQYLWSYNRFKRPAGAPPLP